MTYINANAMTLALLTAISKAVRRAASCTRRRRSGSIVCSTRVAISLRRYGIFRHTMAAMIAHETHANASGMMMNIVTYEPMTSTETPASWMFSPSLAIAWLISS